MFTAPPAMPPTQHNPSWRSTEPATGEACVDGVSVSSTRTGVSLGSGGTGVTLGSGDGVGVDAAREGWHALASSRPTRVSANRILFTKTPPGPTSPSQPT